MGEVRQKAAGAYAIAPLFLVLMLALLLPAAAPAANPALPPAVHGVRPGPPILYSKPADPPQLQNTWIWKAPPILVSGASSYRDGEFVYQDFLYDDDGAAGVADPQDPHGISNWLFAPRAGSLTYPTDPVFHYGAADLVELRVKPLENATAFRITLNALEDPARSAATIALGGTDSSPAREWPDSAGVTSPADLFLTWHGDKAELTDAATGDEIGPASATVDLRRKQIDLVVPHKAWDPRDGKFRMAVGTGLWNPAAGTYLQPALGPATASKPGGAEPLNGAALFNVGFRYDEPKPQYIDGIPRTLADAALFAKQQGRWWREKRQSEALADGDVSEFSETVDFGKLEAGVRDDSRVPKYGNFNRILASHFSFGQGQSHDDECGGLNAGLDPESANDCKGLFVGPLQQYSVYVPKPTAESRAHGYGMTLLLHALSANQNQYLGSRHAQQLAERGTGSIVVTPSGRGPDGFYRSIAEADTFETWADVAHHYRLDPSYTSMSGISMGGIGSWRLAGRYPDLFARIMPVVASAGDEALLPALRNVPVMSWSSGLDELQPLPETEATTAAVHALGLRLDAWLFPTYDHLAPSTNDQYAPGAAFLGTSKVKRNPFHVSYVADTANDTPTAGVIADHAYWVSKVRAFDPDKAGASIDAFSEGFGKLDAKAKPVKTTTGTLMGGHQGPSEYTSRNLTWEKPATTKKQDVLRITAGNLKKATIDAARARLSCGPTLQFEGGGDPVKKLSLNCAPDGSRRCPETVPAEIPRIDAASLASVTVLRGHHKVAVIKHDQLPLPLIKRRGHGFTVTVRIRTRGEAPVQKVVTKKRYAAC